jgi:hypothetical protein
MINGSRGNHDGCRQSSENPAVQLKEKKALKIRQVGNNKKETCVMVAMLAVPTACPALWVAEGLALFSP